ncbi:MAG: hypothetical protein HY716_14225 [Planctomycetes bacterium]|nr:hypothetical protein [Planctomycetota bacterium]
MSVFRTAYAKRRGMVLIIVLSVLAVMAILGVSLVALNNLERQISHNYKYETQARLAAKAGVEDALSRLKDGYALRVALNDRSEWMYFGRDTDGKNPTERAASLAYATRPSFALTRPDGTPILMQVYREDGKATESIGVSGWMAGQFGKEGASYVGGNSYALEVRDLTGCVYLNDGVGLHGGNNSSVSQNLKRILNALGTHPTVNVPGFGDKVLMFRPRGGFPTWQDFKTIMKRNAGLAEVDLIRLERYVTTVAWVDKNVVNPVPLSRAVLNSYPVKYERGTADVAVYRRGPGKNYRNQDRSKRETLGWLPDYQGNTGGGGTMAAVYGQDELNPTYVEVTHRAPVNVNTAEEPVLAALLAELKGFFILEKPSGAPFSNSPAFVDYTSENWYYKSHKVGIKPNYTWEYMGHTYDPQQYPAITKVIEQKAWNEVTGGTNPSTRVETQLFDDHDELGYLWITSGIVMGTPGMTSASAEGVSARAIAREIMRCRNREGNYAKEPFGGPFKNWAQFYAFCDNLTTTRPDGKPGLGILRDERFTEPVLKRQAEQAMADVLKANFNPNFHPNELNPDHNLYLMVDKTDLVVNSTEFCFLPMGYFSVTAVGRVLRPDPEHGKTRSASAVPQEVLAQARIQAVVKAHEAYRETSQRHFWHGSATPAKEASMTNNTLTVEDGPEAYNGPPIYQEHFNEYRAFLNRDLDGYAIYDNDTRRQQISGWGYEASGYLALPTMGGVGLNKAKGQIQKTQALSKNGPADPPPLDETDKMAGMEPATIHGHFSLDDRLHYNESIYHQVSPAPFLFIENMASVQMSGEKQITIRVYVYNPAVCAGQVVQRPTSVPSVEKVSDYPDPGEDVNKRTGEIFLGPYDPYDESRFRLVRSFRLPLEKRTEGVAGQTTAEVADEVPLPPFAATAPSDLRVDGFYSERHSGLAYWIDEHAWEPRQDYNGQEIPPAPFDTRKGTVCFWFKPNFDPAATGKVRTIASVSRLHRTNYYYRNPSPFTLYHFPNSDAPKTNSMAQYVGAFPSTPWPGFGASMPIPSVSGVKGLSKVSPSSLVFNVAWSFYDGCGYDNEYPLPKEPPARFPPATASEMERYAVTGTVNERAVGATAEKDTDGLRARRWSHVTMAWDLNKQGEDQQPHPGLCDDQPLKILLNGREIAKSVNTLAPANLRNEFGGSQRSVSDERPRFAMQSFLDHSDPEDPRWLITPTEGYTNRAIQNTLRLGECSTHSFMPFPRNYSSDGTYDELFVWRTLGPADLPRGNIDVGLGKKGAVYKYRQSRYYVPSNADEDCLWTSPELRLGGSGTRELAPPSAAVASGSGRAPQGYQAVGMTGTESGRGLKLLGVSWTWYAEKYVEGSGGMTGAGSYPKMVPVMVDYRMAANPKDLRQEKPCARVFVKTDSARYPLNDAQGYWNDAFSPTEDSNGNPVSLDKEGRFQYQVQFMVDGVMKNDLIGGTVLLSTPIFDDITIFYQSPNGVQFLEYLMAVGLE